MTGPTEEGKEVEGNAEEVIIADPASSSNPPKDATDEQGEDEDFFASLVADEDFVEDAPVTQVTEPGPSPKQEDQTPPVETPAPAQTAQEPVVQPPVQQPPQGEQSAGPTTDINTQYEEFFNKSVDVLAEQVYKFDEATAEELDTTPSKVIPKLAARLHMQVLTATMAQVANTFPAFMTLYNDRHQAEKEAEDKFFGDFPDLKSHKDLVTRIAKIYHSMNPNDPYEVRAPKIAAMAMVEAKIPLPSQPQPEAIRPPIPTSARGGTPAAAPTTEKSVWEDLIEED